MRQISKTIATSLHKLQNKTVDNTCVVRAGNKAFVKLFGNKIGCYDLRPDKACNMLYLSLCGYNTVTTRERLNAIIYEFGTGLNAHRRFTTKSGEAYFNGMPISDRAVIAIEIPTGNYTIMDGCDKFNPLCLS